MILIAIPNWVHWIMVEFDKTIWGHRYLPDTAKPPSMQNNKSIIIGVDLSSHFISKTKLISVINDETRFLNESMKIVDRRGNNYKDLILKTLISTGKLTYKHGGVNE